MTFKLTYDNVLIRKLPVENTGRVYIPSTIEPNYIWVEVVASGAGKQVYNVFVNNGLKVGDKVLVHSFSVAEQLGFKLDGEVVFMLQSKDIFAVQD